MGHFKPALPTTKCPMRTADEVTNWLPIAGGFLALGHRPRKTGFKKLKDEGATAVLTLLSEQEQARDLGALAVVHGLKWIWLPLPNGAPPPVDRDDEIRSAFRDVRVALEAGGRVLVHCSAGIHRTGMMAFGLLRFLDIEANEAKRALTLLRQVTASGVGDERVAWGEAFAKRCADSVQVERAGLLVSSVDHRGCEDGV